VCRHCGFNPRTSDIDVAKSIYLSAGRFAGAEEPPNWEFQLQQLQTELRNGGTIHYDDRELRRILVTKTALRQVRWSEPWTAILRFLLPGLIVVAVVWLLVWLLRTVH
jgi:hypothetical protein